LLPNDAIGQFCGVNYRPGTHGAAPLDAVFEFPHISWSVISLQYLHRIVTQCVAASAASRNAFEKMCGEERDVLPTLSSWKNLQVQDIQTEVKVAAE